MIELTKVSELATENVAATVVASTVAAGGLFLVTYNLMGPKIRSDKGTSKRNFFTLSKGLGGLKRKEVTGEWKDYDKTFTQVRAPGPLQRFLGERDERESRRRFSRARLLTLRCLPRFSRTSLSPFRRARARALRTRITPRTP